MEQKEIQGGNKLIAKFMGAIYKDLAYIRGAEPVMEFKEETHGLQCHPISDLKYHYSWDWLMPVVEKIEKDCFAFVEISMAGCVIKHNDDDATKTARFGKPKIEMVFMAVITYITWYNSLSPSKTKIQ